MNLIFLRLIEVLTKKGQKTTSMRVAHCCKSFPGFFFRWYFDQPRNLLQQCATRIDAVFRPILILFWLIPRSTEKNIPKYLYCISLKGFDFALLFLVIPCKSAFRMNKWIMQILFLNTLELTLKYSCLLCMF